MTKKLVAKSKEPVPVELGDEVVEWRGTDSKVYQKKNQPGEFQLIGFENAVHYKDKDGLLQDIDLTVKDEKIIHAPYVAKVMHKPFGLSMTYRDTQQRIDMILKDFTYKKPDKVEDNVIEWHEVAKDLDIIFVFEIDHVKIFRRLKTKDASTEIHFEAIIDGGVGEAGILPKFFGADGKGRETILNTTFEDPVEHTTKSGKKVMRQQITDEFTNQVINIDEKTRVRTEVADVEYPVIIDPIVGSKPLISGGGGPSYYDEVGWGLKWSSISSSSVGPPAPSPSLASNDSQPRVRNHKIQPNGAVASSTSVFWGSTTTRFPGITIPMGATINSATLTYFLQRMVATTTSPVPPIVVRGQNTHQPSPDPTWNSPTYAQSQGAISVFNYQFNQTNWVKDTLNATLSAKKTIPTQAYVSSLTTTPQAFDVKDIVQRLVDQFAYSNDAMYFDMRPESPVANSLAVNQFEGDFYRIYTFDNNPASPATSYGNGPQVTKLIIDFSVAGATDLDFDADAMLLYQGAIWGNCGDQPW